jgi:hypothetical protein
MRSECGIQVSKNKENIAVALETLKPTSSWERTTAAGQGIEGVTMGGRGFGVAIDALSNYLGAEYGVTFAMGMLLSFAKVMMLNCFIMRIM